MLAVFLIPLTFVNQDYINSEAQIAYVEMPKVALLRILAGVMALLWLTDWAIRSRDFETLAITNIQESIANKLKPAQAIPGFINWVKVQPSRLLILAAGLFFASTLISTILSASFHNSVWGEIPGQDGYSAYTVASYFVLFAVIATHLKTKEQIARILGAIVAMGVLVGLYGMFQHYNNDFLNITETTGGGATRVTIFMGNAIFAGAVLSMTVPVTLVAAALALNNDRWINWAPLSRLGHAGTSALFTSLWAVALSVQLLGLMFTFSRGPWAGAVMGLGVFLVLILITNGWRTLIRTGFVLALAGVFAVSFLHTLGNVSIINVGPWLGFVLALISIAGTYGMLAVIERFSRMIVLLAVSGVAVVIVGAALFGPSALSDRGVDGASSSRPSAGSDVAERITSIKTDVLGGFVGGRGTHWKISWKLIKERPWFSFDELNFSALRPIIGYGPDLFRYVYLLESPAEGVEFFPLEPDHAHNFFIHQTVEQGILGGIASLSLFISVIAIGAHHVLFRRKRGSPFYRLLMAGMVAILIGRFLEMNVGLARVSDLTILWVLFALLVTLARVDNGADEEPAPADVQPAAQRLNRTGRRRAARVETPSVVSFALIARLAIVAIVLGAIGVVTWQKSINSIRAGAAEGRAVDHFLAGDLQSSLKELDKAIRLAPDVPTYYQNRSQIFLSYQLRPDLITEPVCAQQTEYPYLNCLGLQSLQSNLEAVAQQPFNYRARMAAGNSAFNLRAHEATAALYFEASVLVPNAWRIRDDLAEAQIENELYDQALAHANQSIRITENTGSSARAYFLQGRAYWGLGLIDESFESLKHALSLGFLTSQAQSSLNLIRDINTQQDVTLDLSYFDGQIEKDPDDPVAYYFKGLANFARGNLDEAYADLDTSYTLGLQLPEVRSARAYVALIQGDNEFAKYEFAKYELVKMVEVAPKNPLFNAYYGESRLKSGDVLGALDLLGSAIEIEPTLGLAYLNLSKTHLKMENDELAKESLNAGAELDLPSPYQYADRAEIHAYFEDYDSAFTDLATAIEINPELSDPYHTRAKILADMNDLDAALIDSSLAIAHDPSAAKYFAFRGLIHSLMGASDLSDADYETAESLSQNSVSEIQDRKLSFFSDLKGQTK